MNWSSVSVFGLATIGLALVLHPTNFSLEFDICDLGCSMLSLAFLSATLKQSKAMFQRLPTAWLFPISYCISWSAVSPFSGLEKEESVEK